MSTQKNQRLSRRKFIVASIATTAGVSFLPLYCFNQKSFLKEDLNAIKQLPSILKRKFGNFNFDVTTMGLGGQAALQLTPSDVDPPAIVIKAVKLGINYFDTSNTYGNSQLHYNKAFKVLNLIPGTANYDENLRKSIWITSKTKMKWGNPGYPERPNVTNTPGSSSVKCAIDDLKHSLSQIFGDNKGFYPEGAYLDMILMHSINTIETNDVLFEGLETPLERNGNFGALVALRDYRDGTNLTGMNPKNEKLVRHIGFSGHSSPPIMIDLIQRDEYGILEALLVAINSNDKTKYSMQNNVIPVAAAKGMAIIGMKVFANATLYNKTINGTNTDLFLQIGTSELPSRPLIHYTLTTPGVHTAIMGIGHIDDDPLKCQLFQNFTDAQIEPNAMPEEDRKKLEELTKKLKPNSNYFQIVKTGITAPQNIRKEGNQLMWDNAYAGDSPVSLYEIRVNGTKAGEVKHQPQTLRSKPFTFEISIKASDKVEVAAVDQSGNRATGLLVLTLLAPDQANNEEKVQLYPNPVLNELTIRGISIANSKVSVFNALGAKLIEKTASGTQLTLDVSSLVRGIHFVRFSDGSSGKFIKL